MHFADRTILSGTMPGSPEVLKPFYDPILADRLTASSCKKELSQALSGARIARI